LLSLVCVTFYGYSQVFTYNGINYNTTSDSTAEVYSNTTLSGAVVIPDTVVYLGSNYLVNRVGNFAFYFNSGIESIILPDATLRINTNAFNGCSNLTSVYLGSSLVSIGSESFRSCSSLDSINIPNGVNEIGHHAFTNCYSLTSVNLPESVTTISASLFYSCTSLMSVSLGDNVTTISTDAFVSCSSLTTINFPNSLTTIESNAFLGCSSLSSIALGSSVNEIGTYAFAYCSSLTDFVLPDDVTVISSYTFEGCSSLVNIELGNAITAIGGFAFKNCSSLTSILIPNSVNDIGINAFQGCHSLNSVNIPDNISILNDYVFFNCSSLTFIDLNNVVGINQYAFYGCTSLKDVVFPNTLTYIYPYAFSGCSSFKNVVIPMSLNSIWNYSFANCDSLTTIYIPDTLVVFGDFVFKDCLSLKLVVINEDNPFNVNVSSSVFSGLNLSELSLCLPDGTISAFLLAEVWQDFGFISEGMNDFPQFNPFLIYNCGDSIPALPTTSINGVTGSWSPALNPLATTLYTFTPDNGCVAAFMYIQILGPTATLSNIGTATTSTCDGTLEANITNGNAPFSFVFNSNSPQNSNVLDNACAGFNVVTITDAIGCTTSANYYLPYTVITPPLTANVIISPTSSSGVCDGQSEVLVTGGVPPYTYAHANGSTMAITGGLCEGVYGVTVTDSVGASVYIPYMVAADTNTLYIYQDTISNAYNTPPIGAIENCNINYFDIDSVSVSSVTPFAVDSVIVVWNVYSGGMLEVIPVNYFIGYGQGYYNFILDVYCPTKSSGKFLKVIAKVNISSLLNLQQEASFWASVFPNPFTDKIFMQLTEKDDYTVTMMDFSGRVIVSQMYKDADFVELSQLNGLAKGEYIMLIQSMNDLIVRKLVK
jgi:hypothetical protein